jgi:hypothetical protein
MILEEAIRHAEEVAQKNEDFVRCHSYDRELGFVKRCQKCADEHRQLAEWLRELKERREKDEPQPERLTDDDFETIRIHLSAFKERLCNQRRWEEAEEYQRIIDRFMGFASAQAEPAIPLQWIEAQIEWLKSLDNAFSTLTAVQISVMVNKWKDEQNEKND